MGGRSPLVGPGAERPRYFSVAPLWAVAARFVRVAARGGHAGPYILIMFWVASRRLKRHRFAATVATRGAATLAPRARHRAVTSSRVGPTEPGLRACEYLQPFTHGAHGALATAAAWRHRAAGGGGRGGGAHQCASSSLLRAAAAVGARSPREGTGAERPRYCHVAPLCNWAVAARLARVPARGGRACACSCCSFRRDARAEGGHGAPRDAVRSGARCARPTGIMPGAPAPDCVVRAGSEAQKCRPWGLHGALGRGPQARPQAPGARRQAPRTALAAPRRRE